MADAGRTFCPQCSAPNTGPSCNCGVGYITAGEVAERRLRADPTHADRKIAEEMGIDQKTVLNKRRQLEATEEISSVDRVLGTDGRWYKVKRDKPKPAVGRSDKFSEDDERKAACEIIDEIKSEKQVAAETGMSSTVLRRAVNKEQGRREVLADPPIDPSTLSKTAKEKFDAAMRQYQKNLDAQFEERVQSEIQRRVKEMVYPRLQEREKDAERVVKARGGVFTLLEYNMILKCLHPDMQPSVEQKAEAVQLWHENKICLVPQKEDPKQYPSIPTLEELMARRSRVN